MTTRIRSYCAFGCLALIASLATLFGGASIEGLQGRLLVNGLSKSTLFFVAILAPRDVLRTLPKTAFLVIAIAILAHLAFLLPLPSAIWISLPGRETIVSEYSLLNEPLAGQALSFSPRNTMISFAGLVTGVSAFLLTTMIDPIRKILIAGLIVALACLNALWGFAQVFSGGDTQFYLYEFTNIGLPTGSFANVNHQATLMLASLPMLALLIRYSQSRSGMNISGPAPFIFGTAAGFLIIGCLIAAGSVAGYLIALPTLVFSSLLLVRRKTRSLKSILRVIGGLSALAALCALIFTSPQLTGLGQTNFDDGPTSRRGINAVSQKMLKDHGLFGTGPGSYSEVYRLYEDPDLVTSTYIKHAHNDYIQILIEFGILGFLALAFVLFLIARNSFSAWFGASSTRDLLRRAASISLMVFLLHSLVDYPSRPQLGLVIVSMTLGLLLSDPNAIRRHADKVHRGDGSPKLRTKQI